MRLTSLLVVPLLLLGAGCSSDRGTPDKPVVVTAVYPLQWLATEVGGDAVEVQSLVQPGVEPHDVELTPRQVADLQQADAVLYLKGFQPAVDDAVAGRANAFDLSAAPGLDVLRADGTVDPHLWLDPVRMKAMATEIASIFGDSVGWQTGGYAPQSFGTDAVAAALDTLDEGIRAQLRGCRTRDIVTTHTAFAYLADRYDLVQRGISGLSPDAEPSPRDLADAVRFARANGVTTVFFETLVSPKVAETVAREVGARTAVLDPLESVSGGDDYLSVMRRNAATLHDALGCTG